MIKTDETCRRCTYSLTNLCYRHRSCYECPQGRGDKLECKCNKIQKGEDCPYFEECKENNE